GYSHYLVAMGRFDAALKEIERAQDLDPLAAYITFWSGQVFYHARRYDDALRQDQRGVEMYPDNPWFYDGMADVYEQRKIFAEAFAARQQARSLEEDPNVTALGEAYSRGGYTGYLVKKIQILEQAHNCGVHEYALLNDAAHAMTCLERLFDERDPG